MLSGEYKSNLKDDKTKILHFTSLIKNTKYLISFACWKKTSKKVG